MNVLRCNTKAKTLMYCKTNVEAGGRTEVSKHANKNGEVKKLLLIEVVV
jgi:hypothetical protein